MLLIHGARAVLSRINKVDKTKHQWLNSLIERRGSNRACVALANKNARIIWALMVKGTHYQPII